MSTTEGSSERGKYPREKLEEVREHLKVRSLTDEDVKILEELASRAEEAIKSNTVGGRPIVAHLPFGMDIIK